MWFFMIAIALVLFIIYRFRQSPDTPVSDTHETKMEISSDIDIPLDPITGVSLPETYPDQEDSPQGSLASVNLRKVNVSKEVELVWEAGKVIEFQPGAWAVAKDPSEYGPDQHTIQHTDNHTRDPDYYKRPIEEQFDEERYTLPKRYGIDRLVLMARDPHWIYAYWEVTHEKYREMYTKHLHEWGLSRPVLRVYDLSPEMGQPQKIDFFLNDDADNWYLNISRPRHTLMAEFGRIFPENTFVGFVSSNTITQPADSLSKQISLEWAPIDWDTRFSEYRKQIGISSPWIWGNEQND